MSAQAGKAGSGRGLHKQPVHVPAEGHRGFRTFEPPPEGCVGWKEQRSTEPRRVSVRRSVQQEEPEEGGTVATVLSEGASVRAEDPLRLAEEQLRRELSPAHTGPLKDAGHLRAAREGDVAALQGRDVGLADTLEFDEGVLGDAEDAAAALQLYRSSLSAFDPGPSHEKLAFQAVMRDNDEILRVLFEVGGVQWDARNAAGQTLLEVAIERHRPRAQEAIEAAREQQGQVRDVRDRLRREAKTEKQRLAEREAAEALERERQRRAREEAERAQSAGGRAPSRSSPRRAPSRGSPGSRAPSRGSPSRRSASRSSPGVGDDTAGEAAGDRGGAS